MLRRKPSNDAHRIQSFFSVPVLIHFSCSWNSCKQNKQGANNCTTNQNQTPSPEGEKLHSDSGISVDSQSLQEAQSQAQTGRQLYLNNLSFNTINRNLICHTVALQTHRKISTLKSVFIVGNAFPLIHQ